MLQAAWISLRIARCCRRLRRPCSARSPRLRSRASAVSAAALLFSGMVYAPLVMPEVITGLSLLLLFVAVDVDRGFWTIVIAHTTLTCASSR